MTVLEGIAQRLEDAGLVLWEPAGVYPGNPAKPPVFLYVVPPKWDVLVTLTLYPGDSSDARGEDDRNGWTSPRLQVRTRCGPDARVALALDQDIRDNLHAIGPIVLPDGTNLTDCHSLSSAPLPLGQDANGRWEFTRNYQLTINP